MLQAFGRQCDLGQEGRKVFILSISLLDLEGLLGIQLEQSLVISRLYKVKTSCMESWVFLNVGAVVTTSMSTKWSCIYKTEMQTCTLSDGNGFLKGFCVRVLANNIGYNFYFSLVLRNVGNCMFILLCSCTLDLPPSVGMGGDVFSPLHRTVAGLGWFPSFHCGPAGVHRIFSSCTWSPCQPGQCHAGYGRFVEPCFWPHLNLPFKIFYCHNHVASPGSVDETISDYFSLYHWRVKRL